MDGVAEEVVRLPLPLGSFPFTEVDAVAPTS
jgi:hypothetical protein